MDFTKWKKNVNIWNKGINHNNIMAFSLKNKINSCWVGNDINNKNLLTWRYFNKMKFYHWRPLLNLLKNWEFNINLRCDQGVKLKSKIKNKIKRNEITLILFRKGYLNNFIWLLNLKTSYQSNYLEFHNTIMNYFIFYSGGLYDLEIILYLFIAEFIDFFHIDY